MRETGDMAHLHSQWFTYPFHRHGLSREFTGTAQLAVSTASFEPKALALSRATHR